MKMNKATAFRLWEKFYGDALLAKDFHGNLMAKEAYGDEDYHIYNSSFTGMIYCGWNIHHVFPLALGGKDDESNLICTNIATNRAAADKNTYWVDNILYQVKHGKIVQIMEGSKKSAKTPPLKFITTGKQYKEHHPFDLEWRAFIQNRGNG